ncbi:MAG: oxidoreductase [Calditrichaeota bacterium]|nr:MAG: oxidoreductase [Calditrichota bacterium]
MKQVLQYDREKSVRVKDIPTPQMKSVGLVVDNKCSLISVGTERSMIELSQLSLVGKAKQRPDAVRQVIEKVKTEGLKSTYNKVMGRLKAPMPLGYSSAGVIREVHNSIDSFTVGQRVACAGFGYASHAETIFVPSNLTVKIPDNVSFEEASFVTLGAIALQGVRVADVRLGETVAVIGLGLLGQITCMLLESSGCKVIGIDIDNEKLSQAKQCGAHETMLSDSSTVTKINNLTSGRGVDATIITAAADSNGPVTLAGELCREKGTVVVVGAVKMDVPRKTYYNKELSLKLSRSYGPGRYDYNYEEAGNDYPFSYVRWTENRNMEAFLNLISTGKINIKQLISHRFDISEAETAYELISGNNKETFTGVILKYDSKTEYSEPTTSVISTPLTNCETNIGFIGSGGFATGVLIPTMKKVNGYNFKAIMSGSGISADSSAERFNFEKVVSTADAMMQNSEIGTIFIANRHNQHAELVLDAINNKKSVFVEKPICLTTDELETIINRYNDNPTRLMVGFNRRFAPVVTQIKESLNGVKHPLSMYYRVNGGFIPSGTWIQDENSGGGRIIGEVCHFIDLLSFVTDSKIVKVSAESLTMPDDRFRSDDNLQITLRFDNGSVGTINYIASGNNSVSKEYLEIFGGGIAITMDDFKSLTIADDKNMKLDKKRAQDKGHFQMLESFCESLNTKSDSPIPFNQIVNSFDATFAVMESLTKGDDVWLAR